MRRRVVAVVVLAAAGVFGFGMAFGPGDKWQAGKDNIWSGNTWDNGTPLNE